MRLLIQELEIVNWKGIKNETFKFNESETWFEGANGTGKTSMFDSVLWCLFGIDHMDRSDHQIRPTEDGEPIHRLESSVRMKMFVVDETNHTTIMTLKRVYRELWVKPKTKIDEEYKGNTTDYYINDVPVQKKEYDEKVKSICSMTGFKAVTNPRYFNSLKWDEQRKILFAMTGNVTDESVAMGNEEFTELLKEVTGMNLESYKKALAAKKKKIQDELDDIDPRISELKRNKPESQDWEALASNLKAKEVELESVEKQIGDAAAKSEEENKDRLAIQEQINALVTENAKIKTISEGNKQEKIDSLTQQIRDKEVEKGNKQRDGNTKKVRLEYLKGEKERLQGKKDKLLEEYRTISAEQLTFKEGEFICPTCKRQLDDSDIEEKQKHMTEEFNRTKTERIEKNVREGRALKAQIEEIEKEIGEIGEIQIADVSVIDAEITKLKSGLEDAKAEPIMEGIESKANEAKIADLRAKLAEGNTNTTDDTLRLRKESLKGEIKSIEADLAKKDLILNTEKRIKELEDQGAVLNQEKANFEKREKLVKDFEDAKSLAVENEVNSMFEIVKFKLFRRQVDGQVVPDCECMVDGVLYSTLNNARQVAAGLDIIRVLNIHYNLWAPIFIDNRESVTEIPKMQCQIINLVVNPEQKKLVQVQREAQTLFN